MKTGLADIASVGAPLHIHTVYDLGEVPVPALTSEQQIPTCIRLVMNDDCTADALMHGKPHASWLETSKRPNSVLCAHQVR